MINHSDNKARQQKELWGWRLDVIGKRGLERGVRPNLKKGK